MAGLGFKPRSVRCRGPPLPCCLSANPPTPPRGLLPCRRTTRSGSFRSTCGSGPPGPRPPGWNAAAGVLLGPGTEFPLPTAAVYLPTWSGRPKRQVLNHMGSDASSGILVPFPGHGEARGCSCVHFSLNPTPSLSLCLLVLGPHQGSLGTLQQPLNSPSPLPKSSLPQYSMWHIGPERTF